MTKRQANIYKAISTGIEAGNNSYTPEHVLQAAAEMYAGQRSTIAALAEAYQLITMYRAEYGQAALDALIRAAMQQQL